MVIHIINRVALLSISLLLLISEQGFCEEKNYQNVKIFLLSSYSSEVREHAITKGLQKSLAMDSLHAEVVSHTHTTPDFSWEKPWDVNREKALIIGEIKRHDPDFIVIVDDEALDGMLQELYKFKKPIIFTGINRRESEIPGLAQNRNLITGVLERYQINASLSLLKDLTRGAVKRLSIVSDTSVSSLAIVDEFKQAFAQSYKGVRLNKIYTLRTWPEWKKAIKEVNATDDAVWLLVPRSVKNKEGSLVGLSTMAEWLSMNINVPGLGISNMSLNLGAMAAISVTPEGLGEAAGSLIVENVVDKRPIGDISFRYYDRGEIMINLKQADKIGIVVPIEILEYAKVVNRTNTQGQANGL